eukprot:TRINITY_DN12508_c0_g3_i1.p6 TRINITY_DN12508_c0_g3~~TRINITY_DN12508_c0_g3_i1.p6  ORF type:complete len:105 (+),score=1.36 TRINITY_DN12508_c0_g3_i1:174-488(+)
MSACFQAFATVHYGEDVQSQTGRARTSVRGYVVPKPSTFSLAVVLAAAQCFGATFSSDLKWHSDIALPAPVVLEYWVMRSFGVSVTTVLASATTHRPGKSPRFA